MYKYYFKIADANNVNTIIYNQIKCDKENELAEFYRKIDERKKLRLGELRENSDKIKQKFYDDKSKEIARIKLQISQEIRTKLLKSIGTGPVTYYDNSKS